MDHNFEKIPTHIFDWIEIYAFAQLNASQQALVLTYFSNKEYDQMHQTASDLKRVSGSKNQIWNESRKNSVMAHFDNVHPMTKVVPFNSRLAIVWQAAAILLFLLSGWLFYQLFDLKNEVLIQQVANVDTVYVDKEVKSEPEIVRDTIYLYKQSVAKKQSAGTSSENSVASGIPEELNDMGVMTMEDVENTTGPKGNSMRDDSLLRRFGFYSL